MMTTSRASRRVNVPVLEIAGLLMILASILILVGQLSRFSTARQRMPNGLKLAEVSVGGLSRAEAQARIEQVYGAPISVTYLDQEIRLSPSEVGLRVNSEAMLSQADELRTEGTFWSGFWNFLWGRQEEPINVDLQVEYSEELLRAWLADVAARYDTPPTPAQPVLETISFTPGQAGVTLNQEESLALLDAALRRPTDRNVALVVETNDAPSPSLDTLNTMLVQYLASEEFDGVASIYVIDLQTGDEMDLEADFRQGTPQYLNCDVAYASTSTMKIPIMVEYFRYLDWVPAGNEYDLLIGTMTLSSNLHANLLMREIGLGDTYRGTEIVRNSMQRLGLENTFIVGPYDEEEDPEYFSTPAREAARAGTCVDTYADLYMQTTSDDLASLLNMIYECAEFGGGGLIAAYPDEITQSECQMMLDIMSKNDEGVLIMAGVPTDVEVAHKHGWTTDTHADAGIVFSPGGDYVLTMFLWADVDWLNVLTSFPLMEGISAATFNYFNPDMVSVPRRGFGFEGDVPQAAGTDQ
jgi:beta-lactamase class A